MSFLRLGTRCAVIRDVIMDGHDDSDLAQVLLSQRGDLGTWDLPGGRLDVGELLAHSAAREVQEETGLTVAITRPVGLYFSQGRSRMDVLYAAQPTGGQLHQQTPETRANAFFAPHELPQTLFAPERVHHALDGKTHLHIFETPPNDLRKLNRKLRRRWIQNYLSGRPEPKFPRFDVWSVAVVFDAKRERVFANKHQGQWYLPRVRLDGRFAPHIVINQWLQPYTDGPLDFRWAGVFENPARSAITFVFAAETADLPASLKVSTAQQWLNPQALLPLHHDYVQQTRLNEGVWQLANTDLTAVE